MSDIQQSPGPSFFTIGTKLFDRFEILGVLGAGAKGHVYKARDLVLDNVIALKVLARGTFDDSRSLMRFQSEARIASKLSHVNIAAIFDFGISDGIPYISMEYVEGQSLRELLDAEKTLSLSEFCEIFSQVCTGLICAHKHEIVHRDIKPENIVITRGAMKVKILDFGAAKRMDLSHEEARLTPTGDMVGSPLYMSPEQCSGNQVTFKSDLYALGCVMYECLAGAPPFFGETAMDTLFQHQNCVPKEIRRSAGEKPLPPDFRSMIFRLLEKSPEKRPNLDAEILPLLNELERSLETAEPSMVSVVMATRIAVSRNRQLWVPLVLVSMTVTGIVIALNHQTPLGHREQRNAPSKELVHSVMINATEKENQHLVDLKRSIEGHTIVSKFFGSDDSLEKTLSLPDLPRIDFVSMDGCSISDKSLPKIADKLPKLRMLNLNGTEVITLAGVERLNHLQLLSVAKTGITDDSLDRILELPIADLNLKATGITKIGLKKIARLKKLNCLQLSSCKAFDHDWIPILCKMSSLRGLVLSHTTVNIADLTQLAKCANLEQITIDRCENLKSEDLKELAKQHPALDFPPVQRAMVLEWSDAAEKAFEQGDDNSALKKWTICQKCLMEHYPARSGDIIQEVLKSGSDLATAGDLKKADRLYLIALKLADRSKDDFLHIQPLQHLAGLRQQQGEFREAGNLLTRERILIERVFGRISKESADINKLIGINWNIQKKYDKGLESFHTSLELARQYSGDKSALVAVALYFIGENLQLQGKDKLAKAQFKRAFDIVATLKDGSTLSDQELLSMVQLCVTLANLEKTNNIERARRFNEKALQLCTGKAVPKEVRVLVDNQRNALLKARNG
ncbi:MAG: protein kinase [Cyanobacteria bacterium]|nr:protein kinase [Cyanobacteriota bacterium]